jgi:Bardet-Biedl syndrome 1 protein
MHRAFQSDLCRLRLTTARSYVKLLTDGQMGDTPVVGGTNLRIGAAVQGLGPFFKLKLDIQNGGAAPLTNLPVTFTCVCFSFVPFLFPFFVRSRAVFLRRSSASS